MALSTTTKLLILLATVAVGLTLPPGRAAKNGDNRELLYKLGRVLRLPPCRISSACASALLRAAASDGTKKLDTTGNLPLPCCGELGMGNSVAVLDVTQGSCFCAVSEKLDALSFNLTKACAGVPLRGTREGCGRINGKKAAAAKLGAELGPCGRLYLALLREGRDAFNLVEDAVACAQASTAASRRP
ncbi:hypothetical protein ACP70R_007615 [Stipagrostis hirtigluma subsp. patula]